MMAFVSSGASRDGVEGARAPRFPAASCNVSLFPALTFCTFDFAIVTHLPNPQATHRPAR
jgi:hypothetical protein